MNPATATQDSQQRFVRGGHLNIHSGVDGVDTAPLKAFLKGEGPLPDPQAMLKQACGPFTVNILGKIADLPTYQKEGEELADLLLNILPMATVETMARRCAQHILNVKMKEGMLVDALREHARGCEHEHGSPFRGFPFGPLGR